jgi:hypothetical protein
VASGASSGILPFLFFAGDDSHRGENLDITPGGSVEGCKTQCEKQLSGCTGFAICNAPGYSRNGGHESPVCYFRSNTPQDLINDRVVSAPPHAVDLYVMNP